MLLLVKLRLKRAIRMGGGDLSQGEEFRGIIHSDTIFSALVNEWVGIYGPDSVKNLISRLTNDSPSFKISSAFPFVAGEYFLPTPCGATEIYSEKLLDAPFLELFDFLALAEGDYSSIKKKTLRNPVDDLIVRFTAPRVTIDRILASTNIYQVTGWVVHEGGGLYFLVDLQDETLRDKLELCIRMLGKSGIGGDKSIGYGLFDAEFIDVTANDGWPELFTERQGDVSYCSLSLCCPLNNDEAKTAISYQIYSRKGWICSRTSKKQMKRRECRMFAEGSIFQRPVRGQIADLTPSGFLLEHSVYRYGLGMIVGLMQ